MAELLASGWLNADGFSAWGLISPRLPDERGCRTPGDAPHAKLPQQLHNEGDMEYNLPLNGSIDLDALDDYLMCDHAPDDGMGLSDLDGFLTGVVVGPELILPSEWLPVIWGGQEPKFGTEDEMRTVLGTIMGRYNEIAACFNSDPGEFDPIFWEGPHGEVIASDWAGGFLDAVALRSKAWEPLIENEGAGILMAPLFLLNGDMEIPDNAADENELLAEASDMIPICIAGIHEFWRNYRTAEVEAGPEAAGVVTEGQIDRRALDLQPPYSAPQPLASRNSRW